MTSVAASMFASFTTSPSSGGGDAGAQPDTDAFGAMVGVAATAPSGPTAVPTSEGKLPSTALAFLLATAAVEPAVAAEMPAPAPTAPASIVAPDTAAVPARGARPDPKPDILVVQPATSSAVASAKPPIIAEAPDMPPTVCPAAPDAPTEPKRTSKEVPLPPAQPLPGNRKPETPPIISTLAPAAPSPDPSGDATAHAAEQAKAQKSQAPEPQTDAPKVEQAADDVPPPTKPDLPAILVLPASVIAPVAPAAPTPVADQPASAPDTRTEATSPARPTGPDLTRTAGPTAPAREQVIPVQARDGRSDPDQGEDKPAPSRHAALSGKTAESAAVREATPPFTPATPVPAATPPATAEIAKAPIATIAAQPGRIGQELGIAIAHHVASGNAATGGGETITLRLNPVDMGRIEVKLSFDDSGTLRAVVSADNPVALDMLRRDGADLGRALTDAGVRADAQTLRFDTRSGGGQHGGHGGRPGDDTPQWQRQSNDAVADTTDDIIAPYRPLRTRGGIDMVA